MSVGADAFAVTFAPEVVVEIARIVTWWRAHRVAAPKLFERELDDAFTLIACNPTIGVRARGRRIGDARVVELARSRYRLFYQVVPITREVLVVHVRHTSRRALARQGR